MHIDLKPLGLLATISGLGAPAGVADRAGASLPSASGSRARVFADNLWQTE